MTSSSTPSGRHLLDGTIWILLAEALFIPTGLLTAAFLTRRLGPHGYGVLTLAATLVTEPLVLVAVASHYVVIPWLGAIGAAAVTAGCMSLGAGASLLTVYYLWHILSSLGTLWRSVLVSGGVYALAAFWPTPGSLLLVKLR